MKVLLCATRQKGDNMNLQEWMYKRFPVELNLRELDWICWALDKTTGYAESDKEDLELLYKLERRLNHIKRMKPKELTT